jgi:hypothetical protein
MPISDAPAGRPHDGGNRVTLMRDEVPISIGHPSVRLRPHGGTFYPFGPIAPLQHHADVLRRHVLHRREPRHRRRGDPVLFMRCLRGEESSTRCWRSATRSDAAAGTIPSTVGDLSHVLSARLTVI